MTTPTQYIAFADCTCVAHGDLAEVAGTVKTLVDARDTRTLLVFAHPTGQQVDIDLRGSLENVLAGVAEIDAPKPEPVVRKPGRPKLGVVGREVTLLPRHWEWLNAQPGGASVALRKLVEQARRENRSADRARQAREAAFRFMSAIAGNSAGYEEASRALVACDREGFLDQSRSWPRDVRDFALSLAADGLEKDATS